MKLYYSPGACSLSPHIVAEELGLELDFEKVDLSSKITASGENFSTINPKGYVPALMLDDGSLLTEGPVIVQYLADLKPTARLAPANGSMERYRLQEWLSYINSEIHKSIGGLFSAAPDGRAALIAQAGRRLDPVATTLQAHPFLLGDPFSVADIYLYVVLSWAPMVNFDLSPWPVLQSFVARVGARPAVLKARQAEGLPNG